MEGMSLGSLSAGRPFKRTMLILSDHFGWGLH